jgi:ArsR family transcriptional regulator
MLPIDDAACDAAMLLLALSYVDDPTAVVREAARIIRLGGRVIVVDLLPHDREDFRRQMGQRSMGFSPEAISTMLVSSGLSNLVLRPLPTEASAKGPALQIATAVKSA